MVNESQYMTLDRPFMPSEDTLVVILRRGSVRRPINWLQDQVIEGPGNALGVSSTDDLYTWSNFKAMIEGEYGCILQDFLDDHPGEILAALQGWLGDYMAAHNNPLWKINGWEYTGYIAPEGEPMAGLIPIPPEE